MTVYPAILTDVLSEAQERLESLGEVGGEHTVHIDIIDGQFVENLTITPADFPQLWFPEGWSCDLHLMTDEPMDYVYELIEVKESLTVRSVIGQLERMSSQAEFLQEVKKHGWKAGLAVDLFTPVEELDPALIDQLDMVLLMGVPAGFSGQTLRPYVWEKITEFLKLAKGLTVETVLDGGATVSVGEEASAKGFTSLVVNNSLWQQPNPVATLQELYANER